MAYFNGFPATYQPVFQAPQYQAPVMQTQPQYQQQYQAPQQQAQGGGVSIVQIQGEAAAKSYLVVPNSTVQLWDTDAGVIYIKSADASGMPSMKVLDYTVRGEPAPAPAAPAQQYATKDEVNALAEKVRDLKDEIGRRRANKLMKEDGTDE